MKPMNSSLYRRKIFLSALFITAFVFSFTPKITAQYSNWLPYYDEWQNMKSVEPREYICYRVDKPVVIDGKLDDEAWRFIPWTEYFIDIEGDVKPRPYFRTQAKMAWDETYFYFAADMEETHVWGTLTEHDAIMYFDNDFEIFIDPDSDNHHYYELEINALNSVWDLMLHIPYRDKGERDNGWEIPGLKTAVQVHGTLNDPSDMDRGWSVEFAIPWTVLREYANKPAPPHDGDLWRVNFSRVEWLFQIVDGKYQRKEGERSENWVWSPPGVINMHCPEKYGYVMFSTAKPGNAQFKSDPTEPARIILHGIYYAQRDFFRRYNRYASGFRELGIGPDSHERVVKQPIIELTDDGFTASLVVNAGNRERVLRIRQDSKIGFTP